MALQLAETFVSTCVTLERQFHRQALLQFVRAFFLEVKTFFVRIPDIDGCCYIFAGKSINCMAEHQSILVTLWLG